MSDVRFIWVALCVGACSSGDEASTVPSDLGASPDAAADVAPALDVAADVGVDPGPAPAPDVGPVELGCPDRERCDLPYCDQVLIPAGEFLMGSVHPPRTDSHFPSGDERPIHPVQLDAFCIDRYEATLERYEACVDAGFCPPEGLLWEEKADGYETVVNHYPPKCSPDREVCKHYAVNGKNRFQAEHYCAWIGGRLCTEAEWERVANGPGPQQRIHPWGDDPPTSARVNIPSVGSGYIDPVNSHPAGASVEGVFNLAGNVYEWVVDAYAPYAPAPDGEALVNPVYPPPSAEAQVVGRGSCFFTEPERTVTERSLFDKTFDWG